MKGFKINYAAHCVLCLLIVNTHLYSQSSQGPLSGGTFTNEAFFGSSASFSQVLGKSYEF